MRGCRDAAAVQSPNPDFPGKLFPLLSIRATANFTLRPALSCKTPPWETDQMLFVLGATSQKKLPVGGNIFLGKILPNLPTSNSTTREKIVCVNLTTNLITKTEMDKILKNVLVIQETEVVNLAQQRETNTLSTSL